MSTNKRPWIFRAVNTVGFMVAFYVTQVWIRSQVAARRLEKARYSGWQR